MGIDDDKRRELQGKVDTFLCESHQRAWPDLYEVVDNLDDQWRPMSLYYRWVKFGIKQRLDEGKSARSWLSDSPARIYQSTVSGSGSQENCQQPVLRRKW